MPTATHEPGLSESRDRTILSGIVGSTAYGLAGPDSDVDRLGIFAFATSDLHGLSAPDESRVTTSPDSTMHELGKACRLMLAANPTVTELLWLPDHLYETRTPFGNELILLRRSLLSAYKVRNAYLGYATGQFRRLSERGDGSFSSTLRNRTAKHARHLLRLVVQGQELYATGHLTVQVDDPQRYLEFGEIVAAGNVDHARQALAAAEEYFDRTSPALPDAPDDQRVDRWLRSVREGLFIAEVEARG